MGAEEGEGEGGEEETYKCWVKGLVADFVEQEQEEDFCEMR